MLRELISIRNVGRFLNYSAGGDIDFRPFSAPSSARSTPVIRPR
jgi:hypothetical protein